MSADTCFDALNAFVILLPATACVAYVRKGNTIPEHIYRECIHTEQCPSLCGVGALRRLDHASGGRGQVFPARTYTEDLRAIRAGASALQWPDQLGLGTPGWKRGGGREAFEAKGRCDTPQSGAWRVVAAVVFLEARQRSGLAACTFAIGFSDSEGVD